MRQFEKVTRLHNRPQKTQRKWAILPGTRAMPCTEAWGGSGPAQRLLPGKLHFRITSCINRRAGGEASEGEEETTEHQVFGPQNKHNHVSLSHRSWESNKGQRKLCLCPNTSHKTQGSALLGSCRSAAGPEANNRLIWLLWYQHDGQHKQ